MRPCSKTDHYFLLAAKGDSFALKNLFCAKKYLKLLHGKNKLFNFRAQTHPPVADYINEVRQWPDLPRSRNSLDKALASTNYTSPFYSKESADSCYRYIYLASYEALPTLPVGMWEKCLCKLNPTCIPNAISKVSPMILCDRNWLQWSSHWGCQEAPMPLG